MPLGRQYGSLTCLLSYTSHQTRGTLVPFPLYEYHALRMLFEMGLGRLGVNRGRLMEPEFVFKKRTGSFHEHSKGSTMICKYIYGVLS